MILKYYADVLGQANKSFWSAVIFAAVGVAFFIWAASRSMGSAANGSSAAAVIAGTIVQVISGLQFFIYTRASRQFASFHICLERLNRLLVADTMCDNLPTEDARVARLEVIRLLATATTLVLDDAGAATPGAPVSQKAAAPAPSVARLTAA